MATAPPPAIVQFITAFVEQSTKPPYPRWYLLNAAHAPVDAITALSKQIDFLYDGLEDLLDADWKNAQTITAVQAIGQRFNGRFSNVIASTGVCLVYVPSATAKPAQNDGIVNVRRALAQLRSCLSTTGEPAADLFARWTNWYTATRAQERAEAEARQARERDARARREAEREGREAEAAHARQQDREMSVSTILGSVEPFSGDQPDYDVDDILDAATEAARLAKLEEGSETCQFIRLKLKGAARAHLRTNPDLMALASEAELKLALKERFAPCTDAYTLSKEFQSTVQKAGESPAAFASRLQRVAARWNEARGLPKPAEREPRRALMQEMVLNQFVHGLDSRYRKYVQLQRPQTIQDALTYARTEELDAMTSGLRSIAIVGRASPPQGRESRQHGRQGGGPRRSGDRRQPRLMECFNCHKMGTHTARECRGQAARGRGNARRGPGGGRGGWQRRSPTPGPETSNLPDHRGSGVQGNRRAPRHSSGQ